MKKTISVLGSTGSVGRQTLEVAEHLRVSVGAIAGGSNAALLEEQARRLKPEVVAAGDEKAAKELKVRLADTGIRVLSGEQGVCECAAVPSCRLVLNAISGMNGLSPTLAAIESGHDIAMANKEPIVAAGSIVLSRAASAGTEVIPVDSEHSAIFQCLRSGNRSEVSRLILTASGGPFFGQDRNFLRGVRKEDALCHPTWSMGKKITVDCATLMNKGLEIIEAMHLFSVSADKIDVVIHRESVIHSLVEFCDHAVIAQLGVPSMKLPIQYALTYPDRVDSDEKRLSLTDYGKLTFFEPDCETFLCLAACKSAAKRGGVFPAAVNSANEAAVELFMTDRISFEEIGECVSDTLSWVPDISEPSLDDILAADREVRARISDKFKG